MADTVGQADLRAEDIEKMVKGFALQEYVLKQVVMQNSSSAWKESYYQETADELTAQATASIQGIPRLAKFPYGEPSWTKQSAYQEKYGMEGIVSYEDILTNEVDVIARTMLRIGRAVAKTVDTEIWNTLTENQTASLINSVAITAGSEWDSATVANRDPVLNILQAIREIHIDNYSVYSRESFLIVSPKDFANIMSNAKVSGHPSWEKAGDIMNNGRVGRLLGLTVLVSNVVTADYAAVVVGSECGTWKSAVPLTVVTIDEPGVKKTVRAWEIGVCQLTNPQAVCLISNTQA